MARGLCFGFIILMSSLALFADACLAFSIENTDFNGDLRLRYQYDHRSTPGSSDQRHRGRGRLRFGFETNLRENVAIGVRLATGQTDNRSTNQTFGNFFVTKDVRLDRAYAAWNAAGGINLHFGKYRNALVIIDDLIWDGDINFEGASILWQGRPARGLGGLVNAGFFLLKEDKTSSRDQYIFYIQPGVSFVYHGDLTCKLGLAYYGYENVKGSVPDEDLSSGSNTLADGKLKYDYDTLNPALVLAYTVGSGDGPDYTVILLGDYVYNFDSEDSGFLAGVKFGHAKAREKASWVAYYNYRSLERDAFLDVFPDSDFYGGATGVRGHEFVFQYAVAKNIVLGLDYYRAEKVEGDRNPLDTLQLDCVFKF